MADAFARFEHATPPSAESPWDGDHFVPDTTRLESLVSRAAAGRNEWAGQEGGALGLALDLYAAGEIRRAGFEADAVWPRSETPRVLPAAAARAVDSMARARKPQDPAISNEAWVAAKAEAVKRITGTVGSAAAVVHGEFFPKEVDVLVADWDRGVELLISTKSMTGSYSNNMKNRWEEFVGDVRNMRGRFPLASLGVLFLVDHRIPTGQWDRLLDMLSKLRLASAAGHAYDATALVVAEATGRGEAALLTDRVPTELRLGPFFSDLLSAVFTRLPTTQRKMARDIYGRRKLPTAEADPPGDVGAVVER